MSILKVINPFEYFRDREGAALESGYLYFGVSGLDPVANPITVYWDEALTIPAPQPIRTTNGMPSRAGSPGALFADSEYSILVKDKRGRLVYSASSVTDLADTLRTKLYSSIGATLLRWLAPYTGAVIRSLAQILGEMPVSVTMFGAVGGGVIDDSAAFQAAANTGLTVTVPDGTWKASWTMSKINQRFVGAGVKRTTIIPANDVTLVIGRNLYQGLSGMTFALPHTFTGVGLDFRSTASVSPRYIQLSDVVVEQYELDGTTASTSAAALISVEDSHFFTGYNTFKRVRTKGGQYGCKFSASDIASAMSLDDCTFNKAGLWGFYGTDLSNVVMRNIEASSNGSLATSGTVRTTTHGGIFIGGASRNVIVDGIYCEYNAATFDGAYTPNNIYVDPTSTGVDVRGVRDVYGINMNLRTAYFAQDVAQNQGLNLATEYTANPGAISDASPLALVANPRFEQRDASSKPYGWIVSGSGLYSYDTADKPIGFNGSLAIDPNSTTNNRAVWNIYDGSILGGAITDIAAMAGKIITSAGWFKLTDVAADIATSDVVFGFSNNSVMGGTRQNVGRLVFEDQWVYMVQQYTIAGTETALRLGVAVVNPKCKIKVAGLTYSIGHEVPSFRTSTRKYAKATFDPASLTVGTSGAIQTLTVTGVSLGDVVTASFSLDHKGITFPAWVSAADTISYYAHNPSGNPVGTVDLASGTIHFHIAASM